MSGSERWMVIGVGVLAGIGLLIFLIFGLGIFDPAPPLERTERVAREEVSEPDEPRVSAPTENRSRKTTRKADRQHEPEVVDVPAIAGRTVTRDKAPLAGAEVTVRVIDPTNRVPLEDADAVQSAFTDADGMYRFFGLEPGTYGVLAQKDGFSSAKMSGVKVEEGKTRRLRDLIFVVGGSISGHVFAAEGGAVAGARVVTLVQKKLGMSIESQPGPHAITDGSGYYEIRNVPPGVRNVFAGAEGYATQMQVDVTVDDSQPTEGVDFSLRTGKQITGYVYELETNMPIEGVNVVANAVVYKDPTRGQAVTDENGYFVMDGISQYSYRTRATKKGYVPSGIHIAAAGSEMEYFLVRNGGVRGQVVDAATGVGIADFKLRFGDASGDSIQGIGKTISVSDPSGNFEVYDLNPKTYVFEAWADGYTYSRTEPLELAKGAWLDGVVIRLGKGAEVSGQVVQSLDGTPIAGAPVVVRPDDPRPPFIMKSVNEGYVKEATTDADGRFLVVGVGPGKYRADVVHAEYRNYQGTVFESVEGAQIDLGRIPVEMGGKIQGTVSLADGTPVPFAQVLINGTDIEYRNRAKSDEGGFYEFTRLPPGTYMLEIERIKGKMRKVADPASFQKLSAGVSEGETVTVNF